MRHKNGYQQELRELIEKRETCILLNLNKMIQSILLWF